MTDSLKTQLEAQINAVTQGSTTSGEAADACLKLVVERAIEECREEHEKSSGANYALSRIGNVVNRLNALKKEG